MTPKLTMIRWFAVTVGTGITSVLLQNLSGNLPCIYWISVSLFALNILLFSVVLCVSLLRYAIWPNLFMQMAKDPVQSLYVGLFPMGLSTMINMIVFVCVPVWGHRAITLVG